MILDLIKKSRSHRQFTDEIISEENIFKILEAARYSASAKNGQPLRFAYTINDDKLKEIFKNIALGGALKSEDKPNLEERPRAIIAIVVEETSINESPFLFYDIGIASQNMVLSAKELDIDSCIMLSFKKKAIEEILEIPNNYSVKAIIAFGKGKENVEIIDIHANESTKYFRDNGIHYVPKIILKDLIIK